MTDTLARALASADDHTIDRRKLLKVGAWAAPVVVLAAAVPAASASGASALSFAPGAMAYTWGTTSGSGVAGIGGEFPIALTQTTGTNGAAKNITVIVTVGSQGLAATAPQVPAGWSASAGTIAGNNLVFTFIHTGAISAGGATPPTLTFTLAPATAATATAPSSIDPSTPRIWSASVSGTSDTGTVTPGAAGNLSVALAASGAVVAVPATPTISAPSTGENKQATVSIAVSPSASVVARLTVNRGHNADIGFSGSFASHSPAGTYANGTSSTGVNVATTVPFTGAQVVTFPPHTAKSGSGRGYTLEFLVNGVVFAPATRNGTL